MLAKEKLCPQRTSSGFPRVLKVTKEQRQTPTSCSSGTSSFELGELQWALRSCCWDEARRLIHTTVVYYADLDPEDLDAIEWLRDN